MSARGMYRNMVHDFLATEIKNLFLKLTIGLNIKFNAKKIIVPKWGVKISIPIQPLTGIFHILGFKDE